LCKKTGAIALVPPGLMAGRPAGWLAGTRSTAKFRNFKIKILD